MSFIFFSSSIGHYIVMVKNSYFLMCFTIFLDLNEFLEEVGKSFEGAVGASTAPKNQFVGAGEGITRPYKEFPILF